MLKLHPTNRNPAFSMNHFGQNFQFFHWLLFSRNFWMELKRKAPKHQTSQQIFIISSTCGVSRHLYHFHIWLSTHVWNLDSWPAVIYVTASPDYQACCSTHIFKLCSETAGMFVAVAPDYLAHQIQACISVRIAKTFVVVGLCQQVCLLHLPQTRSYIFYACTRPMGC